MPARHCSPLLITADRWSLRTGHEWLIDAERPASRVCLCSGESVDRHKLGAAKFRAPQRASKTSQAEQSRGEGRMRM